MLNEAMATRYVAAWADKVRTDLKQLKREQNGDFFGQVGSLGFDYVAKDNVLIVRAYIFAYDREFTSQQDMLPWLNRIAAEDPDSVSHGKFETCIPRYEPDKPPSLFLRIEFRDGNEPPSSIVSRLLKLREDAAVWRRNKLTKALGDLIKKERQNQQSQKN